jgi:hypothetical protein
MVRLLQLQKVRVVSVVVLFSRRAHNLLKYPLPQVDAFLKRRQLLLQNRKEDAFLRRLLPINLLQESVRLLSSRLQMGLAHQLKGKVQKIFLKNLKGWEVAQCSKQPLKKPNRCERKLPLA